MADILRESIGGQTIRFLSGNKLLLYPEEQPGFVCCPLYETESKTLEKPGSPSSDASLSPAATKQHQPSPGMDEHRVFDIPSVEDANTDSMQGLSLQKTQTLQYTRERMEEERRLGAERAAPRPIYPATSEAGEIVVDWYNSDDPANAQNWSAKKKAFVALLIKCVSLNVILQRKDLTQRTIVSNAIVKPFEIMAKDPAVLFTNIYTALTYGIYYSFFEVFALVYGPIYGFNLGETGVVFICVVVGCVVSMGIYFSYLYFVLIPDILKNGLQSAEWRLRPALSAVFGLPISLFLFVSVIGITIYATSVYIVMQCIFIYIPMSYPQYAASLFASNDLCRSLFAFAAILFARPMYINLGIGQGMSLLAGLKCHGHIRDLGAVLSWRKAESAVEVRC
ncbi:hypothetical protein B0A55_10618 [Friedmanniomyces simplex]|uniref:Uncharacterized protein n=1 Tax=Friedmanniomyces simplex TaxID=329884 RepID=A0A4U0WZT1_9PEZI|nr:hypothetical protein B0A55_10618 [Friedmanniomyces simplex]